MVWVAPPCTFWCDFSNLNYSPQKLRRLRAKERVFLRFIDEIFLRQKLHGGFVVVENPRTSAIWKEQLLRKWADAQPGQFVDLEMCAFGLKSLDGSNFLCKPMRLLVTHQAFAQLLARLCPECHNHVRIEGAETAHFAAYPSNFGRAVVRAVEKIMINDVFMQAGDKDGPDVEFVEAEQPER